MADVLLVMKIQGAASVQSAINEINTLLGQGTTATGKADTASKSLGSSFNALSISATTLAKAYAAVKGYLAAKDILEAVDTYQLLNQRLGLVTSSSKELADVHERIFEISQKTGTSFQNNLEIFNRFALNSSSIHATTGEIVQLTENVAKLVVVSGASATEANQALIQLSQGFASGQLRGDELRAVMEELPAIARTVADELGLTIGQFRQLSYAGVLSAEDVKNALVAATDKIDDQFNEMGTVSSRAWQAVKNSAFELAGQINEVTGFTSALADMLSSTAWHVDDVSALVKEMKKGEEIDYTPLTKTITDFVNQTFNGPFFRDMAGNVKTLADALAAIGATGTAAKINDVATALGRLADWYDPSKQTSVVDAMIPPEFLDKVQARLGPVFKAVDDQEKAEESAAAALVARKAELAGIEEQLEQKRIDKLIAANQKGISAQLKLEEDWLSFIAQSNSAALADLKSFWQERLSLAQAGTRDELTALENLAKINDEEAKKQIDDITKNTQLTLAQQKERLTAVRDSYEQQAVAVDNGQLQFGLAIKSINEALAKNQTELNKTKTATEQLAQRFNDSFTTIPGAVFDALTGIRSAFRGLFEDVLTQSKSIGDAVTSFFGAVGDAILRSLANVIADKAFTTLFGTISSVQGQTSSSGGWFSDALNSVLSLFGTGGSRVTAGGPGLMIAGERGPELVSFAPAAGVRSFGTGGSAVVTGPTMFVPSTPGRATFTPLSGSRTPGLPRIGPRGGSGMAFAAFQTGGSRVLTQPTLLMAGERGPERATFTPLGGGSRGGGGAVSVAINGPSFFGGSLASSTLERQLGQAIFDRMERRRTR